MPSKHSDPARGTGVGGGSVHVEATDSQHTQDILLNSGESRDRCSDMIATRKAHSICDHLKPQCSSAHVLHTLMQRMTAACSEISSSNVLLELPSSGKVTYHHDVLAFISHLESAGKSVVAVVQPNLHRRVARSVWIERWNVQQNIPFWFKQTCTCRFGTKQHHTIFVGTN